MKTLRTIWLRIRSLWQRREVKREIDEELRFHLEQRAAENLAAGMEPEAAAREARKRFGNVQNVREACRESKGASFGETTWQDVRFGLRMLCKNPRFTIVAVLSLAVGVTLNSVIFSVVDGIWLRPAPFADPGGVVRVFAAAQKYRYGEFSFPDYLELRDQMRSLSGLATVDHRGASLMGEDGPEDLLADVVSRNFFSVLGTAPELGRFFSESDDATLKNTPSVVISHRLWQRRFGGDRNIVGRSAQLTGRDLVVLGVAPPDFAGIRRTLPPDVWFSQESWGHEDLTSREWREFDLVGRLKPGYTAPQAQAEAETIFRRLDLREEQASGSPERARVVSEARYQSESNAETGLLLLGIVGAILLLACANVACLLLARAEARTCEMAIRSALGGGRLRIVRQLLTESLLLALLAGGLSMLLAGWILHVLPAWLPSAWDHVDLGARLDGRVLVFTSAVSLLALLVFALAPALHASRANLLPALKGERSSGGFRRRRSGLDALVVGQMSLALAVLSTAILLARSVLNSYAADLGFDKKDILMVHGIFQLYPRYYGNVERQRLLRSEIKERVLALPGVKRASVALEAPYGGGGGPASKVFLPDDWASENSPGRSVNFNSIDTDYLSLMGIRLLRGRGFTEHDNQSSPKVALVSETMARTFWANEDPLGKYLRIDSRTNEPVQVVGVVRDVKRNNIEEIPEPYCYLPNTQTTRWDNFLLVETSVAPASLAGPVRRELQRLGVTVPRSALTTMKAYLHSYLFDGDWRVVEQEVLAKVVALIGLLGLGLAAIGLYGVQAFAVSRRTQEIGIRMALGAQRQNVLRAVLCRGMSLALAGVALGLVITLATAHLLRGFLYSVKPDDPLSLGMSSALLLAVSLLACWSPARRASKVEPMEALRCE